MRENNEMFVGMIELEKYGPIDSTGVSRGVTILILLYHMKK